MSWFKDAACTSAPLDWFFPRAGGDYRKGKAICATCPVRDDCLAHNLDNFDSKDDFGLWGGTTPSERRVMREGRDMVQRCQCCGHLFTFTRSANGRPMYCSNECRQDTYRERKRKEWRLRNGRWVA